MITSPINPMRYWKLEEIQRMLNQIKGYENVVIEFQYTPSEGMGWHSDHYDCTCGIKEQLVNGQWNWLLKYKFQVNDKNELGDVRAAAFQEMAEQLITDVWRTSINSFRKQQRELNKPKAPTMLTEQDLKIMDEINEMENKRKNTIQTNKNTTWTEIKLWSMSVLAVMVFLGCVYLMVINKTALFVFGITVGVSAIIGLVVGTKILIESACEEVMKNKKQAHN